MVLFHAGNNFIPSGFLGVDVFFVISGFVVTPLILRIFTQQNNLNNHVPKLIHFYVKRFFRLAPALALTLVTSAILIFLLGPTVDHQRIARQGFATLFLVGNIGAYHFSGDYFNSNPNPLIHTWSLSVEEQIFIFLPLLAVLIFRLISFTKHRFEKLLIFTTAFSIFLFIFPAVIEPLYSLIGLNSIDQSFKFWFYSPVSRVWQFTLGGLCFFISSRSITSTRNMSRTVNLVILFIFFVLLYTQIQLSPQMGSISITLTTCFILIYGSIELLPRPVYLILKLIGDRSYSIYLMHMPLLYLAKYSAITSLGSGENRALPTVFAIIITFLLGSLSYSKIENRYRINRFNESFNLKTIYLSLIVTFLLPLLTFTMIYESTERRYWGLNINYAQAPSALGKKNDCEKDPILLQVICNSKYDMAQRTVLLMGDSHAEHLRFALSGAAKEANWNSVYIPGKVEALDFRKKVAFEEWIRVYKPDLLIISQFWNGTTLVDEVSKNLFYLKNLIPNILVLENNPIWPDPSRFRLAGYLVAPKDFLPKTFPLSQMGSKEKNISNKIASLAKKLEIDTKNFDQIFCSNNVCTRYSEFGWLYNDYNHFTSAGANMTIPILSEYLKELK